MEFIYNNQSIRENKIIDAQQDPPLNSRFLKKLSVKSEKF